MTMKRMTKLERDVAMHLAVHLQPGSLLASRAAGRAKRSAAAVRRYIGSLEIGSGDRPLGSCRRPTAAGRGGPLVFRVVGHLPAQAAMPRAAPI